MSDMLAFKNSAFKLYIELSSLLLSKTTSHLQDAEGILRNVEIEFSIKTRRALGICYPQKRKIVLNLNYFSKYPHLMAYTLFHECVHQLLFDLNRPWHHTPEFYKMMSLFPSHKYQEDKKVYIHQKSFQSAKKEILVEEAIKDVVNSKFLETL